MIAALFALALAGQCASASCPNPCRSCTYLPVQGTDPDVSGWRELFTSTAERSVGADVPSIAAVEAGPARTSTAAPFPCRLLPAIAATESGVAQFCGGDGLTVISFDCGFGVMQVTSGAANYPGIQSSAAINIAAGADILAQKWNSDGSFGGHFGDSDPALLESWYFAVWAYNGFVYSNNPNNPDHVVGRAPFRSPGSSARRDYPYQEIVWGYLQYPAALDGEPLVDAVAPTYPPVCSGNIAACCVDGVCRGIPNQQGLFSVELAVPEPSHTDACTEVCPPTGCPPDADRTVILDDADPGFSLRGDASAVTVVDAGGYRDAFHVVTPTIPGRVVGHFAGRAPSSGRFLVAGWVPLSPASQPQVAVVVTARGGSQRFSLDQSVNGGFFAPLGEVELLDNEAFTVDVLTAGNGTADDREPIGIDAFSLAWRGDGDGAVGASCSSTTACSGAAVCIDAVCVVGCDVAGCRSGTCDAGTGLCTDEGEGEGEGVEGEGEGAEGEGAEGEGTEGEGENENEGDADDDNRVFANAVVPGCGCHSTGELALGAVALLVLARRRRSQQPAA
jgi:MYXO-CTERM domain-containing protein